MFFGGWWDLSNGKGRSFLLGAYYDWKGRGIVTISVYQLRLETVIFLYDECQAGTIERLLNV